MAVEYVDLACTSAALVRDDYPDTNYHGAEQYELDGSNSSNNGTYLLLTFEELPAAYQYRGILSVELNLTINRNIPLSSNTPSLFFGTLAAGFDANTVTWNTKPSNDTSFYNGTSATTGTGDEAITITAHIATSQLDGPEAGYTALKAPGLRVHCSNYLYGSSFLNVYTNAAASGKRPFLRVAVTDTNAGVSVDKKPVNGMTGKYADQYRFACNKPSTFSWDLSPIGLPYADVVQDAAVLYWRKRGTSSWNTVSITGSDPSYIFPANTLPAADIEWSVVPVCGDFIVITSQESVKYAYPRYFAELPMTGAALTDKLNPDQTVPWTSTNSVYHYKFTSGQEAQRDAYLKFAAFPQSLRLHAIEAASIRHRHIVNAEWRSRPTVSALAADFAPEVITWENVPEDMGSAGYLIIDNSQGQRGLVIDETYMPGTALLFPFPDTVVGTYTLDGVSGMDAKTVSFASRNMLTAPGLKISMPMGYFASEMYGGAITSNPAPVLLVMLFDETVTSKVEGKTPTAGWINPHEAQTFSWDHVPDGDYACAAIWETVSATLYWSSDNGSTWNSVAAPANSKSVTLPADTLPAGTIQWYVTATDDQGTTGTSPTYTITTEDSETTATPTAPIQTVEDGREPIVFRWTTANDHGTLPTGADLQISTDGTTWTDLGSVTGSATEYTAAADTLPPGTVYWRVRAYNADGTAGSWSAAVSFVSVNAPAAPTVSVEAVPFATIRWQADGQQAYRVTVDGTVYGPFFGSAKSFTLEDYLENGGHTASVEVQGSAGLWSKPGTATFQIQNVPGDPIQLSGVFYRDAQLRWETTSAVTDFLVYRDSVRIAHTRGSSFTDRTVLGGHSWQIINRLPGGYYTPSNTVQGELKSCGTAMALLAGGEWLELKKTDSDSYEQGITVSQQISLRHFEGAVYPVAEASHYIDQSSSYLVAWTYQEQTEAAAFEAMMGRPVILKARGNECTVGIMAGFAKRLPHFYKAYSFNVQRIHWEDFIDEDD